jgi:flagellar basal body-associated protein FliL
LYRGKRREGRPRMSLLWIILIVVLVLALFGFIGRGYW